MKQEVNWGAVERIQEKSFHGGAVTEEESKLCLRALKEDRKRYSENAARIRAEYAASLRVG